MGRPRIDLYIFSGKDCGVCRVLKPKLIRAVESEFPMVGTRVIEVENEPKLTAQFGVFTLPVVSILVDDKEQYRFARSFAVSAVLTKLERLTRLIESE